MAENVKNTSKKKEDGIWETVKVVLQALLIAFFIRLFLFQPFNIPSGSMIPTLRVGDFLFVSKLSYGYGKYSFNFTAGIGGLKLFSVKEASFLGKKRILALGEPIRGDVVVFKLPSDNSTDFIKRLVGLPGDTIQVKHSILYINGKPVPRKRIEDFIDPEYGKNERHSRKFIAQFRETLPNGVSYVTHDFAPDYGQPDNTRLFKVPPGHYFMMGDNRDNSDDSRGHVGFVPKENLVGRAKIIFFSHTDDASLLKPWQWPWVIRWSRLFKLVGP